MRILFATDNSPYQHTINGVVVTNTAIIKKFREMGHEVEELTPDNFKYKFEIPFYKGLYCAIPYITSKIKNYISSFDFVHIVTEGTVGLVVRNYCLQHKIKFTSAYHTKFPEYSAYYFKVPTPLIYNYMRWFHRHSLSIFTTTTDMNELLKKNGFNNKLVELGRGVVVLEPTLNHNPFQTYLNDKITKVYLYVGRVAAEKNIESFLKLQFDDAVKIIIGHGPELEHYKKKYSDCIYLGKIQHDQLRVYYENATVCVFPSLSDTFGLTNAESLTYGTPVAMFKDNGINSIVNESVSGMDTSLRTAILKAEQCDRQACIAYAREHFCWDKVANKMFFEIKSLVEISKNASKVTVAD